MRWAMRKETKIILSVIHIHQTNQGRAQQATQTVDLTSDLRKVTLIWRLVDNLGCLLNAALVFPISGIWISLNAFIVILNLFSISSQTYETNKIKIVATMMILIQTSRNEFTHNMLVSFLLKENLPLNRLLQCHRDIFDSQMEDADIIKRKFEVLTSKHLNLKMIKL